MESSAKVSVAIKNIVSILLLVLFAPVGIVAMWYLTKWPKILKIVLSLVFLLPALIVLANLFAFVARPYKFDASMEPNFKNGQSAIPNQLVYRFSKPKRGDVILFKNPLDKGLVIVERIIGLPGETVKIQGGKVYVNESELNEPYLDSGTTTREGFLLGEGKTVIIPSNSYFVLGDNRVQSKGSRDWGFLPSENIIGRIK